LTPQASPAGKEKLEYELAYYLHPDWQGKGIIKNAVLALLSWAIEEEGVKDVFVRVVETNAKSRSVVGSIPEFKVEKEGVEIKWPKSKGGDVKLLMVWRLDLGNT
jgi:RimJ/RimL family protein N-acetyltransferase